MGMIILCWLLALAAMVIAMAVAKTHAAPWPIVMCYWIGVTVYWIVRAIQG